MDSQYEIKYNSLMQGLEEMHEKNVKRTRAALRCLLIIPAIILLMLFMTKGSKTIFLVLWIASMFVIAFILIVLEYQDYLLKKMVTQSQAPAESAPQTPAVVAAPAAGSSAGQRADAIRQSIQQRSPDQDRAAEDFKYDNYNESAGKS